jgi:predicted metal-dependent phosphotriesterase family hydrolase
MEKTVPPLRLLTVTGPIEPGEAGITDAHNHVWIEPVPGAISDGPVLDDQAAISEELNDYHASGGGTILDCQPGGCGRNGQMMQTLADASAVQIVACTGYHLRKYYPPDFWLFRASVEAAHQYFVDELTSGLKETENSRSPARAGFIKIACEDSLQASPLHLMQAAVQASLDTGAAIEVHTEKGSGAESIIQALFDYGLPANKLVLCHLDKRVDFGFHRAMAQEDILLEYDTFYRPKYHPDENVWPLLERMVAAGHASQICIATDMAEAHMWVRLGGQPGLTGLVEQIIPKLEAAGFDPMSIQKLTGENIIRRLLLPISMPSDIIERDHA